MNGKTQSIQEPSYKRGPEFKPKRLTHSTKSKSLNETLKSPSVAPYTAHE